MTSKNVSPINPNTLPAGDALTIKNKAGQDVEVIAERRIELKGKIIKLQLGKPCPDGENYKCAYRIEAPNYTKTFDMFGTDSMSALHYAQQLMHTEVFYSFGKNYAWLQSLHLIPNDYLQTIDSKESLITPTSKTLGLSLRATNHASLLRMEKYDLPKKDARICKYQKLPNTQIGWDCFFTDLGHLVFYRFAYPSQTEKPKHGWELNFYITTRKNQRVLAIADCYHDEISLPLIDFILPHVPVTEMLDDLPLNYQIGVEVIRHIAPELLVHATKQWPKTG